MVEKPADVLLQSRQQPVSTEEPRQRKMMEVFCGCARLSQQFAIKGFRCCAIDFGGNKDKPAVVPVNIDLSTAWGRREFWKLVDEFEPDLAWFAAPCGSASRARDIRRNHGPDPQPLRSEAFPDGLPGLNAP